LVIGGTLRCLAAFRNRRDPRQGSRIVSRLKCDPTRTPIRAIDATGCHRHLAVVRDELDLEAVQPKVGAAVTGYGISDITDDTRGNRR